MAGLPFSLTSPVLIVCLVIIAIIILIELGQWTSKLRAQKALWLPAAYLGFILTFIVILANLTPLQSWDSLNFWAARAKILLDHYLVYENRGPWLYEHPRHPLTLVYFHAVSAKLFSSVSPWIGSLFASSVLPLLLVAMISYLHAGETKSLVCFVSGSILVFTIPLQESHFVLTGYAEVWIAVLQLGIVLFFNQLLKAGLKIREYIYCLCGSVALSICLMSVKNSGVVYVVCVWVAFSFTLLVSSGKLPTSLIYRPIGVFVTTIFLLVALALWEFTETTLPLGGYDIVIQFSDIREVMNAYLFAWAASMSFSVWGLTFFLILVVCMCRAEYRRAVFGSNAILLMVCLICTQLVLLGAIYSIEQIFLGYSQIGSDLGYSRAHLPTAMTMAVVIPIIVYRILSPASS